MAMTNPLAETRIGNLRLLAKLCNSVAELNARAGRRRGDPYFYQILQGVRNPSGVPRAPGSNICAALETAFGLPGGWMNFPHEAVGDAENAIAEKKRAFSAIPNPPKPEKPASSSGLPHQIPLLSAAGESFLLDPHLAEGLSIEHPAAFIVADDSMAPRFLPGDILVIDLDETAIKPGFFIIESEGAAILRKIGTDVVGRRIIMADGLPGMIAPAAGIKILGAVRRCFRPVRP